jgi:hypothetical protein
MDPNLAGLIELAKIQNSQIAQLTETVSSLAEDIRFMQDVHYDFQIQHNRMEQRYLKQNSDMLALRKDFAQLITALQNRNVI